MQNNAPKISIIVPVYKVEQYLSKCIDSILAQTFKDWELLLIDDGSPDDSGKVCDEYVLKDSRIRVFHKENGGVSSARNLGLEDSKGEFVMFVDSDDWLSTDCLQVCVDTIKNDDLDALQFGFISVNGNTEIPRVKVPTLPLTGEEYIKSNSFNVCVGGGVYKRDIIEENKLRFPKELKLAEDQIFVLSFFKHTHRIKYIDRAMYYYLQRDDSAVHTPKSEDMLKSCDILMAFGKEWSVIKSHIDAVIVQFIINMIKNNNVRYSRLKEIYINQRVKNINSKYGLQRIFPRLAKLNFYFACWIINLYLRIY